jgi:hypothetical protein
MSATNEQLERDIADLQKRVAELERLLLTEPEKKRKPISSQIQADCKAAAQVPIPILFANARFLKVWKDFCEHRCKLATQGNINRKKFAWTPRAAQAILKKMERWDMDIAIEALNISIDKEWADVFLPDDAGGRPGKPQSTAPSPRTPSPRQPMRL